MYNDMLDYLQRTGKCERWVMEWFYYNREQMKKRDFELYKFALHIHLKYF